MEKQQEYMETFQSNLDYFFNKAVDLNLTNLRQCGFWIKTMNYQNRAAEIRQKRQEKGLPAPPVMICSITKRCNLACKGCYARTQNFIGGVEMTSRRFESLSREASDIGTNIIMLAGGEPLMRRDILEAAAQVKHTIFPVITNGTLINSDYIRFFKENRNIIPVLSIEGDLQSMDERRGPGLYGKVISLAEVMRRSKMFFGLSMVLTRDNFDQLTDPQVLQHYHKLGSRLFFFVEYVPEREEDHIHCITEEQKKCLPEKLNALREQLAGLYVCLPGEEEQYGGCLAAGRGFVHISPFGDIEPCPFAPYSDSNIIDMPLTEALNSLFLSRVRNSHELLKESAGGCALWENREWVEEQLKKPESLSA